MLLIAAGNHEPGLLLGVPLFEATLVGKVETIWYFYPCRFCLAWNGIEGLIITEHFSSALILDCAVFSRILLIVFYINLHVTVGLMG